MALTGPRISARALLSMTGGLGAEPIAYAELAGRIRELIIDGRIPVGSRLPSERELAALTGRSRTTVVAAYQRLRHDGYALSRQGSGSRATLPHLASGARRAGSTVNFAGAVPPPVAGLRELIADVTSRLPDITALPGFDLIGLDGIREAIADRYTQRGLTTSPDQVLVTTGGQHAISLTAHALVRRSDVALVETPTYPHAYEAFQRAGARLVAAPVTTDGWDVPHLFSLIRHARPVAAYLIPDFHNPTGASMAPDERERLLWAARDAGTTLVIDEATVDLNIDRRWDDGPFARHAARTGDSGGSGVITLGSLSKSIWSGLRIGWIRADAAVIRRLVQARPAADLGTPPIEQFVGEAAVRRMDELVSDRRRMLRANRDAMIALLERRLPEWKTPKPDGGMALWVQVNAPATSALPSLVRARGLSLTPGTKFSIDGSMERFLRLPMTGAPAEIDRGIGILAQAWSELAGAPPLDMPRRTPEPV